MSLEPIILAELQRGGPPLWVSGRTYPKGWEVRSPANLQRYVRKVAGAGATDPSADANNWEPWSKTVDTTLAALATSVANVKAVADALAASVANVKAVVDAIYALPRGVKSIQRGLTSVNQAVDVTINEVNPAKTQVNLLTAYSYAVPSQTSEALCRLQLVSSTVLRMSGYRNANGYNAVSLSWEVIEFH